MDAYHPDILCGTVWDASWPVSAVSGTQRGPKVALDQKFIHPKSEVSGDILPANFLDVIRFSANFFGFYKDFPPILGISKGFFKKPYSPHHSLFGCML